MGVLARLFRRSQATEETTTEETTAREAETTAGAPSAATVDGAPAEQAAEGTPEGKPAEAGDATGTATEDDAAPDGVGIPRQQSAEEAVDSEAGEDART
ncbi:hypothetical protein ACH4F6_16130 [Streptomyces sp. NPDC017936]|uniref:hypothetical protein n=1 Tax=Streptomyces sp. NPDC017936 TaxID=3365016 RepID=UPI0037B5C23E